MKPMDRLQQSRAASVQMVVRSLSALSAVLLSTVSALDYDSLELEEGAGRQIFTSGGVAYLALNQTFALLIGRSLYTTQPTLALGPAPTYFDRFHFAAIIMYMELLILEIPFILPVYQSEPHRNQRLSVKM